MHYGALQYFIPGNPPLTPAPNQPFPHPHCTHNGSTVQVAQLPPRCAECSYFFLLYCPHSLFCTCTHIEIHETCALCNLTSLHSSAHQLTLQCTKCTGALCKQRGGGGGFSPLCFSILQMNSIWTACRKTAQVHCANRGEWRWQLPQ